MAKTAGRTAVLNKNATAIAGVRVLNITRDSTFIDITDADDDGFTTLLTGADSAATSQLTLGVEGLEDGQVLRDIAMNPATDQVLTDITFDFPNGDEISGNFALTSYNEGNPYQDATTFSATFVSSGEWTYTPSV